MYNFVYYMMLIGFFSLGMLGITWKEKLIGVCLTIVNGLIFWRG